LTNSVGVSSSVEEQSPEGGGKGEGYKEQRKLVQTQAPGLHYRFKGSKVPRRRKSKCGTFRVGVGQRGLKLGGVSIIRIYPKREA